MQYTANGGIYFPLSDSWTSAGDRVIIGGRTALCLTGEINDEIVR